MQDGPGIWLANKLGVEIEVEVEPPIGLGVIDRPGHQYVSGVVITLGLNKAAVELRQFRIDFRQCGGKELKLFATAALDERAADQVINDLVARAVADGAHQPGDPCAGTRLRERNAAALQEREDELEMLELLDGDGVKLVHPFEQLVILLERDGGRRRLAFEVRVISQNRRQIGNDFGQPIGRNFFAEQQHAGSASASDQGSARIAARCL